MKTSESQTFNKHWIHRTFLILNKIQGCIIFSSNFQTKFRKHSKLQKISRHSLISRQFYQTYQPCYECMCVGRSALCVGVDCANFVNLYEIKFNQIVVIPLHGAGENVISYLVQPPPTHTHTHTIQYNTSQHKINHHCNQCFKDNVCKQRTLLVLGGWLS